MKKILLTAFLAINIFAAYAQSFTFRGTVVDENNEPIDGVMVNVKESRESQTLTDLNGKFEISLSDTMKYHHVELSASGYLTQEYHLDCSANDVRIVMTKSEKAPVIQTKKPPVSRKEKTIETTEVKPEFMRLSIRFLQETALCPVLLKTKKQEKLFRLLI